MGGDHELDGIECLEMALEELRHASFGYFGPVLREQFQSRLGWTWSAAHYRLLRAVQASHPIRPTLLELGGALLVDKARASRLVTELQQLGLVRRIPGRLDRRRREVELTDEGFAVLEEARALRQRFVADALHRWDDGEVGQLASLLERFNSSIRDLGPIQPTD